MLNHSLRLFRRLPCAIFFFSPVFVFVRFRRFRRVPRYSRPPALNLQHLNLIIKRKCQSLISIFQSLTTLKLPKPY